MMIGGVRGAQHGHGFLNEAGKELLSFLSINEATVCNTCFPKRAIHKQIWQHPRSKQWHCIDYAIVRKTHRRRCMDVNVMRGAQCNTDHMTFKMKLQFGRKKRCLGRQRKMELFDVSKLQERSVDEKGRVTTCDQKLLHRYIRNANVKMMITECLFADDGVILASTRPGAEKAVREYHGTCSGIGLKVSNPKTKIMTTGRQVKDSDRESITVGRMRNRLRGRVSIPWFCDSRIREDGRRCREQDS